MMIKDSRVLVSGLGILMISRVTITYLIEFLGLGRAHVNNFPLEVLWQVLNTLECDLKLKWIVELTRIVQHNHITHMDLGHGSENIENRSLGAFNVLKLNNHINCLVLNLFGHLYLRALEQNIFSSASSC